MNQQVKDLIQKLGEAIHESVSESDNISGVVKEIREQGFDVLLMLEATLGLNEVSEEVVEEAEVEDGDETAVGPFTRNDLSFLKSLRITTEENAAEGIEQEALPGNYAAPPLGQDLGRELGRDLGGETSSPSSIN